jgi:hypothetical protein
VLSWDGATLVAVDPIAGRSVRLAPAALYHYRYRRTILVSREKRAQSVNGLAGLDSDGLVLLDLPGEWSADEVAAFAAGRGIPVEDALLTPSKRVRTALARRAPGWERLVGQSSSRMSRWKKVVALGTGAAGLLVMAYIATTVGMFAWRGLSVMGRALLDLVEAKWLAVFFSPLAIFLGPAYRALHARRSRRGTTLGPPGGPCLVLRRNERLRVWLGPRMVPEDLAMGPNPDCVGGLLLYRHEHLSGLFIMSGDGRLMRHLPGPWPPEDAHRFAVRLGLSFEIRTLGREEYLGLTSKVSDAVP